MKKPPLAPLGPLIFFLMALPSCGVVDRIRGGSGGGGTPQLGQKPAAESAPIAPLQGAQSAAALDQSSAAEKAAAVAAPTGDGARDLGAVVVALGSPAEQGFWLRSALVTSPASGRVVTAGGASVNVELQPGTRAALLSLAAYRALGLALTDLPQLQVFAD